LQVIEKSGKRGRGRFFADVRLVWRVIDVRLCFAHGRFRFGLIG
jgi:hypothetical protein